MKKVLKNLFIATAFLAVCGFAISSLSGCALCRITDSYNSTGDSVKVCLVCDSVAQHLSGSKTQYLKLKK